VYHRVNNDLDDAVTVSVSRFDEQMAWLAKHRCVVSLLDLLQGRITRRGRAPIVAITFDDGYLDNYVNAAPILKRYNLPATFFVTTALIGTDIPLAHDLRRLGYGLPLMTWAQLRELRDQGCTIGSHTETHVNCSKAEREKVRSELSASLATLRENLQIDDVLFAYPYGGKGDFPRDGDTLIREIGFAGCASAYGGENTLPLNPYNIRRVGVDDRFDLLAFRARVDGYQISWWQRS